MTVQPNDDLHTDDAETEESASPAAPMLRKKEIVAAVAQETGQSKADIRRTLDAAFAYMRQGLLDGNELHYPTLGKVRIKPANREGAKPVYRVVPSKDPVVSTEGGDED